MLVHSTLPSMLVQSVLHVIRSPETERPSRETEGGKRRMNRERTLSLMPHLLATGRTLTKATNRTAARTALSWKANLFEPDRSCDTARPKAWGGLGCVLVLVKLLVELHGWGVNVYSSEGMGVCSLIHGGHKKVLSYFIQPFYEKEEESTAFLESKGEIRLAHPRNLSSFTCPPFLSLAPYSVVFLHARSPSSFPFSWAKKKRAVRVRSRETWRGAGPTNTLRSALLLLRSRPSSYPSCSRVPAPAYRTAIAAEPRAHSLRFSEGNFRGSLRRPPHRALDPLLVFLESNSSSPSPPTSAPSSRAHSRV